MAPLRRLCIHGLAGSANAEEGLLQVLRERGNLRSGLRVDGPGVEFIVGVCEPASGRYDPASTEVILADETLKVFEKVHVLPYKDTFKYNFDHMYHEYIVPYFHTQQQGEFTEGFDFSYKEARFSVIGTLPEKCHGVVGQSTTIFYEGPAIERTVLDFLHVLPFVDGLPERYMPTKLSLDDAALLRDYVQPYFERRSSEVLPGDYVEIQGVRFKVVATKPGKGGGVGKDTELSCKGVALREAGAARAAAVKAKAKAKAGSVRPKAAAMMSVAPGAGASAAGAPGAPRAAENGAGGCTVS